VKPLAEACPTIVELEAYLDVGSEVGIGPHVRTCRACAKRLDEIRSDATFLADFSREADKFRGVRSGPGYGPEFPAPPAGYTIQRVLGRGGQAVVYEAMQASTRRRVALKIVRLGVRDVARRLRRFDREIDLVSNLRHPLIVTVFDSGMTSEGEPYLVMEYVEGTPVAYDSQSTLRDTLAQFQRICEAIRHAHQQGVVHRDIKPSNILVDRQGLPRVLDFGLATTIESRDSLALTKTGEFLGTPIYAAPEQLRGGAAVADVRTDVYALGVILYELLTGTHPFATHSTLANIVSGILEDDPKTPSSVAHALDYEIDTIVLKAIAKAPDRRYRSVDALHADIAHYLAGEPIEAKRDSTWYMLRKAARRHRWAFSSGAGLLVLLIAFSVWMSVLYGRASETSRQLSRALATRDLDHGLDLSRADNLVSAEPLLWGEYLHWLDDEAEIANWAQGPLLQRRAHWGLWELYQGQPCLATVRLGTERMRELYVESPESIVATTTEAHVLRWNPRTGARATLFTPTGVEGALDRIQTRYDVDRVFALHDGFAYCWELSSNRLLSRWRLPDHEQISGLSNLARIPSGVAVATGHPDGVVRVWSADDGALLRVIPTTVVTSSQTIVLEDTGVVWVASVWEGTLATHDLDSGVTRSSRESVLYGRLAVAPDGRAIHSWKVWSGIDEQLIATLEETTLSRGRGWVFGAGGSLVVGKGNTTPIWRADTGQLVRVLASHDAMVCALGPDDRTLATAHADGTVRAWDIAADAGWRTNPVSDTAHCVRFGQSGRRFVIAGSGPAAEPFLEVLDVDGTAPPVEPAQVVHRTTVASAAFVSDGALLVTGDHNGLVVLWRVGDDGLVPLMQTTVPAEVNALSASPDGDWVAGACDDGNIWLWRPADGALRCLEGHRQRVSSVEFSADGARLVSGSADMTARLWSVAGTEAPRVLSTHNGDVRSVCFGPAGRWVATAGDDQIIQLWDAQDGRLLHRLSGHGARVFAVAVSSDGALLASGDASGRVMLWDVQSGTYLASLIAHNDMVFSLDFSPDGSRLVSGAADRTTRIWDLRHYERHLAGNFAYQQAEHAAATPE
jgi:serine/threonine protein kinase/WD40 repeat protein